MSDEADALHTLSVAPSQAGIRLDKWLAAVAPGLSRSRIQALIAEGRVTAATIGGEVPERDPNRRVRAEERFALRVPAPLPARPEPEAIPLTVVHEDSHLIVLDKPAGMAVHPAPGSDRATLVNALLHHCGASLSGIGGERRPGIVHRLDKDTSGLLVAAKTDAAHRGLAAQFAAHSVTRAYRALVWGLPTPPAGELSGPIGRSPANRKKMAVVANGRPALTRYRTLRAWGTRAAWVECRLATGRTHQIRVHMAAAGHPLVGDPLYGGRGARPADGGAIAALAAFRRQALHAWQLGFSHPATGERLLFESDIPSDIKSLLDVLG